MKSSEFADKSRSRNTSAEKARYPVWYSESFCRRSPGSFHEAEYAGPQLAAVFYGAVYAGIIGQENLIDDVVWDLPVGLFHGHLCIVGRHDHDRLFTTYHTYHG